MMRLVTIALLGLAACSGDSEGEPAANAVLPAGPDTAITQVKADSLPAGLQAVIDEAVPGMRVEEAERKEREGRIYYDVEGQRPDGSEVELDILQEGEAFRLVEIQRDIAWGEAPAEAIAVAKAAPGAFEPARVIESRQTDGTIIYELFAPGRDDEPAMEVRVRDGKAELLEERWAH